MRSIRPSTPRQDLHALMDRILRLGAKLGVAVAADRMRDHRKGVAGEAEGLRHDPRRPGEPVGHDRCRRRAGLLGRDRVVQTARRAAPSVAPWSRKAGSHIAWIAVTTTGK